MQIHLTTLLFTICFLYEAHAQNIVVVDLNGEIINTTGQEDHFNDGTLITRKFIEGQNTSLMKDLAERYSLTAIVIIHWKN